MILDAHHHFWDPGRIPQPWLTGRFAPLARPFGPDDLGPLLGSAGVTQTVLVQSASHDADTDWLFELADDVDWVGGIVAWLPLDRPDVGRRLRELQGRPKLCGFRHLINVEADPHWILRREVEHGLGVIEEAGLPLDLPAEFPHHLEDVPELARRHPALTFVVDHLAKPPRNPQAFAAWRDQLAAAGECPNVFAKVSGLGAGVDVGAAVGAAVASFGAERLLFGSDWPLSLLIAGYSETVERSSAAVRAAAGDAAEEILVRTGRRVYGLA